VRNGRSKRQKNRCSQWKSCFEKTRQVRAFEELYGPPTPEPLKLTEAEQRERWDKAEAARSEMQRNAPCQFTGPKYPPSDWPEQGPWRPAVPPVIKPEPTEDEIKAPPVGSTVIVKFSDISKQAYRVLTQPDSMGLVKCTPLSGMMVGKVFEMHVREF
jgi:hypothetical protein